MAPMGRTVRSLALPCAALGALLAGCGPVTSPRAAPDPDAVEVGYGTQSRGDLTGSVASLSGERLNEGHVSRVEQLIQGRLAGVEVIRLPGNDFTVRIRGATSFTGGGEPLYVIDGVPVQSRGFLSALGGIAPSDVARIDVLKDAGSAAIYGSQGANGVILITTRRQ